MEVDYTESKFLLKGFKVHDVMTKQYSKYCCLCNCKNCRCISFRKPKQEFFNNGKYYTRGNAEP